jgi:hypothetical protein
MEKAFLCKVQPKLLLPEAASRKALRMCALRLRAVQGRQGRVCARCEQEEQEVPVPDVGQLPHVVQQELQVC